MYVCIYSQQSNHLKGAKKCASLANRQTRGALCSCSLLQIGQWVEHGLKKAETLIIKSVLIIDIYIYDI